MALGTPLIVALIFFILNVVGLICVGIYVAKLKSRSFFEVFRTQRIVFGSLLIFFLDQATDIGVLVNWYYLMTDGNDYESINEKTFFYPLLAFFCIYQFIMTLTTCESTALYDILLVIFLLYPFKTAYTSLMESLDVESNTVVSNKISTKIQSVDKEDQAEKEDKEDDADNENPEEKQDMVPETAGDVESQDKPQTVDTIQVKGAQLSEIMVRMLIVQCTLETLPGLVLQSVFWVRSFNDSRLIGRNSTFIAVSIIASLVSLASRYIWIIDSDFIADKAKGNCLNIWYLLRIVYRVLSIIASFIVFVMLWVVVGGFWIGFWILTMFVAWTVISVFNGDPCLSAHSLKSGNQNMIALTVEYSWKWHVLKLAENLIGMLVVFTFLWGSFECEICVSSDTRESYKGQNNRVAFLFALGWISTIGAFVLYVFMHLNQIFVPKKD